MKEFIEIFKNLSPTNWLNILLATAIAVIGYLYVRNSEIQDLRYNKLENDNKVLFKMYQDCINKK